MKTTIMETLYRKVAVSERLPKESSYYLCKTVFGSDEYVYFNISDLQFESIEEIKFWLEEIPDTTAQLKADKAELLEVLGISLRLNKAFGANSEWIEVQEIESLIQKHKQ